MAYTNGSNFEGCIIRKSSALDTAAALTVAANVYGGYLVCKSLHIKRIMFYVTTAVAASTTAPVVSFYQRPTTGSATGQILVGSLTIPTGSAAGTVVYKNTADQGINFLVGHEISLQLTVQGVDATAAAGAGFFAFELDEDPEDPRNMPLMVASV